METKIKSNKSDFYLTVGVILIALAALFLSVWNFFNSDSFTLSEETGRQYQTITTGTTVDGDVEISLTPAIRGDQLVVSAALNTHSVDLSAFDLRQAVSLEPDGKIIPPMTTFPLSGHHGSGEIIFKLDEAIDSFTITITGIPELMERKYAWR